MPWPLLARCGSAVTRGQSVSAGRLRPHLRWGRGRMDLLCVHGPVLIHLHMCYHPAAHPICEAVPVVLGVTRGALAVCTACHLHSVASLSHVLLLAGHAIISPHPLPCRCRAGPPSCQWGWGGRLLQNLPRASSVGSLWGCACTIDHYLVMSRGTQGDRMACEQDGWSKSLWGQHCALPMSKRRP